METKGSLDGVAYDTSEHTVTVTVTKDDDNVLSAEVTYGSPNDDKTAELVENIFTPTTAEISVRKELKGREWQDGDEFTFTLAPVDGAPMPLDEDGNEMATVTVTVKDGEVYGFGTIIYNKAGSYTYTIVEAHGSLDGVSYDANEYTVKVIVSKDEDNALSAKLVYEEDGAEVQIILNEFTPTSAELKVRKDLQGREWRDGDNFRFLLKAVDGAPMPDGAENGELILTVKDDLEHSFGLISYVKAGTYKYILTEIDDGLPGVTYDSSEHTVTVTVSKDEETNALSAEVDAEMTVIVFANPYDSECELVLEAEKELENKDLEEGQFGFILKDEDGNVLQTKSNDADGKVVFDAIAFTEEDFLQDDGTYAESITRIYTVEEVIPDEIPEWYSYDESIYTATVTLTDNGDGTITVDIQWTKDGEKDDRAVFTNSYDEPEWTEKEVIKKWDDNNDSLKKRPDSITVHLLADGEEILTDTITEADGWKKTFTKLRRYAEDDGHEIVYSVTEDKVEGYTAVINGLTITNSMIKAGDESQPVLWSTTFAASTLALGAAILLKRRKEEEE